MTSIALPEAGSRWVSRRGKHAGNEIQVVSATERSVRFKPLGGGDAWGNQKTDDSRILTLTADAFQTSYVLKGTLESGSTNGGVSFRRRAAPKPKPLPSPQAPLSMNGIVMTGGSELTIEVLVITPEQARAWLERGGRNRKMSERRVVKLVGIIQRGEWELTGETIKLDADGTVRDGQHRLEAIARAGMPVQSVVVRNIRETAFDAIDTGAARSAADVLSIHGYGNRISLASEARALMMVEATGRYVHRGRKTDAPQVTPARVLAYVQAHPETEDTLRLAYVLKTAGMAGGAGLWAAALTLCWRVDKEALQLFVQKLHTGAGLDEDDPILRLRNRVITEKMSRSGVDQTEAGREYLLAVIIKAWNLWRNGERIRQLTWHGGNEKSPEAFPVPI